MRFLEVLLSKPFDQNDIGALRATVAIPLLIVASDGVMSWLERRVFLGVLSEAPALARIDRRVLKTMIRETLFDIRQKGAEAVFTTAVDGLNPAEREDVLKLAILAALAEKRPSPGVGVAVSRVAGQMGVSQGQLAKVAAATPGADQLGFA